MPNARFEDLIAWQRAKALTVTIYALSGEGLFARDFGLRDQIRRAALSTMSNLAEGFERYGNRELAHFLSIAKGSAGEVRSQLYVAHELKYIDAARFSLLRSDCVEVSRLIAGLRSSINSPPSP